MKTKKEITTEQLKELFEQQDYNVFLTEQDGVQCAEVEKWTDGGVDMVIWLNPFSIKEFESYINDFDIDNEIMLHRQDKLYCANFTIKESLKDFNDFHKQLKKDLKEICKKAK